MQYGSIWQLATLATLASIGIAGLWAQTPKPPVEAMRLETETLLEKRAAAAVEPEAVARELKLGWPVAAPTKTPAQLEAELQRLLQSRATSRRVVIDEATIELRAKLAIPMAKIGDPVALKLTTGGELRGELQDHVAGAVKVGGRTVRTSAIAPESLAILDPQANAKARETWRQRERTRLMSEQDTTVIGGADQLRQQLYRAAGYVYWREHWLSPIGLLEKAVAYRRQTVAKKLRPQIVEEVAARYGFAWRDGKWLPLPANAATRTAAPALPSKTSPTDPIEALFEFKLDAEPPGPVSLPPPLEIDL